MMFKYCKIQDDTSSEWLLWATWIDEWLISEVRGLEYKVKALNWFLTDYLMAIPTLRNPEKIFDGTIVLPDLMREIEKNMKSKNKRNRESAIIDFLNWVRESKFSDKNEGGVYICKYNPPFEKSSSKDLRLVESVYTPLPFYYIEQLRDLICPKKSKTYSEWTYSTAPPSNYRNQEWHPIPYCNIDRSDPDCIWHKHGNHYYIWNPSVMTALLVKLYLPLRTYQIRFLDSGETDSLRYQQGQWVPNSKLPKENKRTKRRQGVFRKLETSIPGKYLTGLYINTNKTADLKNTDEVGYTIPWENPDVLYWLEKLRNWQEKYNSVLGATPCSLLKTLDYGSEKSDVQKASMGEIAFLFRKQVEASGYGFPIGIKNIQTRWYRLLDDLEDQVARSGETHTDGSRIRFVPSDKPDRSRASLSKTNFPLHSLRVSLLTALSMEGEVPLPILSKVLAGHSSILMTLHYIKPQESTINNIMANAEKNISDKKIDTLEAFLQGNSSIDLASRAIFVESVHFQQAISPASAAGWQQRHVGICLMNGNQTKNDEKDSSSGCWNGGEDGGPVPHRSGNCIRCRWFVTDATYIKPLVAHFNYLSYCSYLAASEAMKLSKELDKIKEEKYLAINENRPFLKKSELDKLQRRYESQVWESDQFTCDMVSCLNILRRIQSLEKARVENDTNQKLVANCNIESLDFEFSINEIDSEFLHICQVCDDAELYPDIRDEVSKLPAIPHRTNLINRAMIKNGYKPLFLELDKEMQLIAANSFLREIGRIGAENDHGFSVLKRAVGILEAEEGMLGLDEVIGSISQSDPRKIVLKSYL